MYNVLMAFGITLCAGLATGIGGFLAFVLGLAFIALIDKVVPENACSMR